jgi:hypothetical protein
MPYDPSLPLPNSPLESQVIRDQLQALFVLINNIVTVTVWLRVEGVAAAGGLPGLPLSLASRGWECRRLVGAPQVLRGPGCGAAGNFLLVKDWR